MNATNWILRAGLGVVLLGCSGNALFGQGCKEMAYDNQNPIDPKAIALRQVQGTAVDPVGTAIPQLCIGIFTEPAHKLVRYTQSDNNGVFVVDTNGLPDGEYRLVGQVTGFCPANAILTIKSHSRKKKSLVIRMNVRGIDSCSNVGLAKK
jgi:hypothetical protein